jgi:SAM-dependent methyltransferase
MEREEWHRRFWNRWARWEERRERDPEKRVYTALVWRTIQRYLSGVKTVLDVGAGPGRFSLPLARLGLEVTHLDLSPRMVALAQRRARRERLKLDFTVGKVEELPWPEKSFDLVLCLDAPVSYASSCKKALRELARVTAQHLILSVVNRLGQVPVGIKAETRWRGDLSLSRSFLASGEWQPPDFLVRYPFIKNLVFPPLHAFTPAELRAEVEEAGLELVEMAATGTLGRLVGRGALKRILRNPRLREEFLGLCEAVEREPFLWGVGAEGASGLLAVCRPASGIKTGGAGHTG